LISHALILPIESAPTDRCRTDKRTVSAKSSTTQFATPREIKLRARRDLVVCRDKERIAKAERDRTGDNSKTEVEKIRDGCDRTTDEPTSSFDHLRSGFSSRVTGVRRNRCSRRFGFETSVCAASAETTIGFNTDVPDMPSVAIGTIK